MKDKRFLITVLSHSLGLSEKRREAPLWINLILLTGEVAL